MDEQQPNPVDPIAAQADRLEKALADLEARKKAAAELATKNAPQIERLRTLQAKFAALPQSEQREVSDALETSRVFAGMRRVSAAPEPDTRLRGGFVAAPTPKNQPPRWPVWQSLPRVELWQAVLLSMGVEPDKAFKLDACGDETKGRIRGRLPPEFFVRQGYCVLALSEDGPIRPQIALCRSKPLCDVLLSEVGAFLARAGYEVAPEMLQQASADRGPQIKRSALKEKYERTWPTIDRDLRDASANGLSAAAKAGDRGMWFEISALTWGQKNGKYTPPDSAPKSKASPFGGLGS